jgi:hypothetical protein
VGVGGPPSGDRGAATGVGGPPHGDGGAQLPRQVSGG